MLRGFVFLKQNIRSIFGFVGKPLLFIGRFSFKYFGIPVYRLVFFLRHQFARLYIPAKNRFLFVFTNRYVFHAVIVTVAAVTSVVNIQAGEVRAETFGSKSLLYGALDKEASLQLDEVSAAQTVPLVSSGYSDVYAISTDDVNFDLLYEEQVATALSGGVVTSPTISESEDSVAARTIVEQYVVQDDDVLGSIAEKYNLSLSSLLWANNLTFRSTIRPGQNLIIPPTDGVLYKVKSGDTISSIAKKYKTEADKILAFNDLSSSEALEIGKSLMLPDATPPTSAPVRYAAPVSNIFTGTVGGTAPAAATGSWVWPTDGCSITVYFHQYYFLGLHQGLDIDGDYVNSIYASRGGKVVRSGWNGGYGNSVDINHGDGYTTRYGHMSKLFVSVGDTVNAGDAIGKMGTTGTSTGTHLHFQIMENGANVNPLNFIRCR